MSKYIKMREINGVEIGIAIKTISVSGEIMIGGVNGISVGGAQKYSYTGTDVDSLPDEAFATLAAPLLPISEETEAE